MKWKKDWSGYLLGQKNFYICIIIRNNERYIGYNNQMKTTATYKLLLTADCAEEDYIGLVELTMR